MRFMCIGYADADTEAGVLPTTQQLTRMGAFMEEITGAGVLLAAEGLHPSSKGARISFANGQFTATDGPFTEAKELIAGYVIIQVASKEEALDWTRRYYEALGEGRGEIRQLVEDEDFGAELTPELRA